MSGLFDERLAKLRARMSTTKTDLAAIGPSSHMMWLAGLSPHGDERPVMLLVSQQYAGLLMPALNVDSSRAKTGLPFHVWADEDGSGQALRELIGKTGINPDDVSVALDETMRADFALGLLAVLPGARHTFTTETVGALRAIKDAHEYEVLKKNALIDDVAMKAGFAALRPGITEREVADIVSESFERQGAATGFTSVCFGANGAFPHHYNSDKQLGSSDAVLLDIGGRIEGYPSDMTRVGYVGEPPIRFTEIHAIVERAVQAALDAVKPGVPAWQIDKAARDVISAAGYGANFLHRTGHGMGIDGHEPPYVTATSETVLEEGMVFSIEPGIYLAGQFGIRLEDIAIVRSDGAEVLSELSRAPIIVAG